MKFRFNVNKYNFVVINFKKVIKERIWVIDRVNYIRFRWVILDFILILFCTGNNL